MATEDAITLPDQMAVFEKSMIAQALQQTRGCAAAAVLRITRKTLYDKLHKYGLRRVDHG